MPSNCLVVEVSDDQELAKKIISQNKLICLGKKGFITGLLSILGGPSFEEMVHCRSGAGNGDLVGSGPVAGRGRGH
jgi:hypothetical protein